PRTDVRPLRFDPWRAGAIRSARNPAGAPCRSGSRGGDRSDRDRDRQSPDSRSFRKQHTRGDKVMEMHAPAADRPTAAPEPWRRRLVASLLYGRNVDRAAKARAPIVLATLLFSLGHAIIAARLMMFPIAPEGHASRRAVGQDAVATARPDILDRNGQTLATHVRTPSLVA